VVDYRTTLTTGSAPSVRTDYHGAGDLFLDHPYAGGSGSIQPTEMRRTLTLIDHGSAAPGDEHGIPHPT
jgi:hypothetical protein